MVCAGINWLSGNRTSGTSSIKGRISFLRGKKFNVLLFQTLHFDEKNQICIYLTISNTKHLFMSLLAICISSLEKCLFRSAAHFFISFFILICKSYFYIVEVNYLSATLFANIFSHSVGFLFYLFTLLCKSF